MNDPRPVALKLSPIGVTRLRTFPSLRIAGFLRKRRERLLLVGLHLLAPLPTGPRRRELAIVLHAGIIRRRASLASLEFGKSPFAKVFSSADLRPHQQHIKNREQCCKQRDPRTGEPEQNEPARITRGSRTGFRKVDPEKSNATATSTATNIVLRRVL